MKDQFWGEFLGTFVLVFFGCGAVATAVSVNAPMGLFQVAIVWGLGLTVAIYLTGGLSGAHLNPAISLAFAMFTSFSFRRLPLYFLAQFLGAFLAAAAVYGLYGGCIAAFEQAEGIQRGELGSEASAMIFGEYYPNPGGKALDATASDRVSMMRAFCAEFLGTLLLAFSVFGFTTKANTKTLGSLTPFAIGMALTVLICVFAPLTMAGFNPARDLAPRVFSSLAGWGAVPFTVNGLGWLFVYVVAPCGGALCGAFLSRRIVWVE